MMNRNKFLILLVVALAAALAINYWPKKAEGYNPDTDKALQSALEA